jgi:hypothetical protein
LTCGRRSDTRAAQNNGNGGGCTRAAQGDGDGGEEDVLAQAAAVRWRCRNRADGDGKGAAMRTGGGAVARGRQTAVVHGCGARRRGGGRRRVRAAQGGAVTEVTVKARGRQKPKTSGRQRAGKRVI